jgi:hypothetical protein
MQLKAKQPNKHYTTYALHGTTKGLRKFQKNKARAMIPIIVAVPLQISGKYTAFNDAM